MASDDSISRWSHSSFIQQISNEHHVYREGREALNVSGAMSTVEKICRNPGRESLFCSGVQGKSPR